MFLVDRPVAKEGATGDFFFHFCKKQWVFFPKNGQYFHGKKNRVGGKKLQPPDWLQFKPPAVQETEFLLWTASQPYVSVCVIVPRCDWSTRTDDPFSLCLYRKNLTRLPQNSQTNKTKAMPPERNLSNKVENSRKAHQR